MNRKTRTLSDADITSARAVTRRTLLTALGVGAGVAAATVAGAAAYAQSTPAPTPPAPEPTRRDPCRDADHGPPADGDGCGRPPIS
jgi:hypothetical protein